MTLSLPTDVVVGLLLATSRIASFLLLAPPFAHRGVPAPVKAMLALGLALAVQPEVPDELLEGGVATGPLLVAVVQEVLIGTVLGFLCYLVLVAVQAAGDILDVFGGFQMAFAYDPLSQSGSSVMGRVYQLTALALLFATNGYLLVVAGILRTFDALPVGAALDPEVTSRVLVAGGTQLFVSALQIAAPLVAVLFLADVGLGLLTRVAPALNAFSMGFPLKILLTVVMVGLSFSVLPRVVDALASTAVETVVRTAGG